MVLVLQEDGPGQVHRMLFRHALVVVRLGQVAAFLHQGTVGNPGMIHIVNNGRQCT